MLVLSRKENESITIIDKDTDEVVATIMLVRIEGNKAKLGLDAPQRYQILRDELMHKPQAKE